MRYNFFFIGLLSFILGCTASSNKSLVREEVSMTQKDIAQAAQYVAQTLCEPGKKVCIGKIQEESQSQNPLIQAFLDEMEVAIAGKMDLLERKRLQDIIEQQKLQTSDFFQQEDLAKIGNFARVDYMILGEIHERTMDYDVLLKMVCMQSAIVKKAAKAAFSKDKIPSHIIREMARLELISKGYRDIAQGKKGEILSYFTRQYNNQTSHGDQEEALAMQFKAEKRKEQKISPMKMGETLAQNDEYRFQVLLNKSAYLYSVALDSQGKILPIFPYGSRGSLGYDFRNPLKPNTKYQFPPQKDEEGWFMVQDKGGIGQIGILVSLKPMPELENLLQESSTQKDDSITKIQNPLFGSEEDIPRSSKGPQPTQEILFSSNGEFLKIPLWYNVKGAGNE